MGYSSLANYRCMTSHKWSGRAGYKISAICIHHMAGNLSVQGCGKVFANKPVSAHYGIDNDGNIGVYVDEKDSSWSMGSKIWNRKVVSIELANCTGSPTWKVADKVIERCIDLVVDIAYRNGWKSVVYDGTLSGNLICHRQVAATSCPGPYMINNGKVKYIAQEADKKLKAKRGIGDSRMIQATYNGSDAQHWKIVKTEDGYVKIVNKSGKVLDIKDGASKPMADGRIVQAWKDNGTDAQKWKMIESSVGGYMFASKLDENYCIEVKGGTLNARAYLQMHKIQSEAKNKFAQSFYVMPTINGDWNAIVSAKSFFAVDSNPTGIIL